MNDHLGQLGFRLSVLLSPAQVAYKLLGVSVGDQSSDGDQASVTLRQVRTFPDVAKQNIIREIRQLGCEAANQLLRGR